MAVARRATEPGPRCLRLSTHGPIAWIAAEGLRLRL